MRLQSALEYVTTYGWAILIIAIALVALILLGLFNVNAGGGTYCVGEPGYTCSNPVLNASGYLSITFSEAPNPITLTGTACSLNDSVPSYILPAPSPISISPYTNYELLFTCPLPSGSLGTHIIDTLWIRTDPQGDPSQVTRIGTVSVSVTTNGTVITTVSTTFTSVSSTSTTGTTSTTTGTSTRTTTTGIFQSTSTSTSTIPYYQCGEARGGAECPYAGGTCPANCPVLYNGCLDQSCPTSCPTSGITCLNLTSNLTLSSGSFYGCTGAMPDGIGGPLDYSWDVASTIGSTVVGQSGNPYCEGSAPSGTTAPSLAGITVGSGGPTASPETNFSSGTVSPPLCSGTKCRRAFSVSTYYNVSEDGSLVEIIGSVSNQSIGVMTLNDLNCSGVESNIAGPTSYAYSCIEDVGDYNAFIDPTGTAGSTNASIEVFVWQGGAALRHSVNAN